jgi:hypothetical protein
MEFTRAIKFVNNFFTILKEKSKLFLRWKFMRGKISSTLSSFSLLCAAAVFSCREKVDDLYFVRFLRSFAHAGMKTASKKTRACA